jgi:hypothetical protein
MSERCSTCGGTGRIKTVDAGGKEVDVECGTCEVAAPFDQAATTTIEYRPTLPPNSPTSPPRSDAAMTRSTTRRLPIRLSGEHPRRTGSWEVVLSAGNRSRASTPATTRFAATESQT